MGRLSWVTGVSPQCNPMHPGERSRGRFDIHREEEVLQRQSREGFGDWSDVATSQGMSAVTWSWEKQGTDSEALLTPRFLPSDTDFWLRASRTVSESFSFVLSHLVCGNLQPQETNTPLLSATLLKPFPCCLLPGREIILFFHLKKNISYRCTVW